MRSNLFWLSDEQWRQIEPHLSTDVRGKEWMTATLSPSSAGGMIDFVIGTGRSNGTFAETDLHCRRWS